MILPDIEKEFNEIARNIAPPSATKGNVIPVDFESSQGQDIMEWSEALSKLQNLENGWQEIWSNIETNRKNRRYKFDTEALRRDGVLLKDETIFPRQVIDTNMGRGEAPYMQFIKNTRRTAIIRSITDTNVQTELLERDFTRLMRYDGWELPQFKTLDSGMLHGWSAMQIMFDPDMPGDVAHKFIATDKLIFPKDSVNIQNSDMLTVIIDITLSKLKTWIDKFGFDPMTTNTFIHERREDQLCDRTVQVKHLFYRGKDGYIYTAWYDLNASDWLKKPRRLWLGKRVIEEPTVESGFGELHMGLGIQHTGSGGSNVGEKIFEREYPIELFLYNDSEEEQIITHRGRGEFDLPTQQAQTNIWSGFINKLIRASNVYASPSMVGEEQGAPKLIEAIALKNGGMYNQPVNFWSFDSPDTTALMAIQALATENQQDTNQLAFTVLNRDDARKTKREMDLAVEEQGMVNSVDMTLWSIFQRRVATRSFDIIHNRAKQGLLPAFLKLPAEPTPEQAEARKYLLDQEYELRAAGDQEVIEKSETLAKMGQFYPLIAESAVGPRFLSDMLTLAFPERGADYATILQEQRPVKAVVQSLAATIGGLLQSHGDHIPPDQIEQINQILQESQAITQQQP